MRTARLFWGSFSTLVDLTIEQDQPMPKSIVLSLETCVNGKALECAVVRGTLRSDPPDMPPSEGWEFKLRRGCECDGWYDAAMPPWAAQVRAALRSQESVPCP